MEHAAAVEIGEAGQIGDLVGDAGGDQELARFELLASHECDLEVAARLALRAGDFDVAQLDAVVLGELAARDGEELGRRHPVASEIAVHRVRGVIPRPAGIADQHRAAAPAQDQRGTQPGWSSANDYDVEHDGYEVLTAR